MLWLLHAPFPVTPLAKRKSNGKIVLIDQANSDEDPVNLMGLSAAFTAPFNMTGQPAASIPVGLVDGLPAALQVVAARHGDDLCLGAGALLERLRPWPKLAPLAYE